MRFRVYDNEVSADRYTVVFAGDYLNLTGGEYLYIGLSGIPFHPQSIGYHGGARWQIDAVSEDLLFKYWVENAEDDDREDYRDYYEWDEGWVIRMGEIGHLGKRIRFRDLPPQARKFAAMNYKDLFFTPATDHVAS